MATIKLVGILTDVFPVEIFTNFTKKVFWLKEPDIERYPQHWAIELHGNDVERLKGIATGDRLECFCEIRGKKFNRRNGEEDIITTIKCIGITVLKPIETVPNKAGKFTPKDKPGRESDSDRLNQQGKLL